MQLDGAAQFQNILMNFCYLLLLKQFFFKFLYIYLDGGKSKNMNEANIRL